jgi:hypothetical protein
VTAAREVVRYQIEAMEITEFRHGFRDFSLSPTSVPMNFSLRRELRLV